MVTVASSALILIAAVFAIHYQDRTKAQFIFSTTAVIILLFALSFPYNPLNLIALLAAGSSVPPYHGLILTITLLFCIIVMMIIRKIVVQRDGPDTLPFVLENKSDR